VKIELEQKKADLKELRCFSPAKKFEMNSRCSGIYLLAMQIPDGSIAVKIGYTRNPSKRYSSLLCAMPFESVMKWAPIGVHYVAKKFESYLHQVFSDHHTRGEWFLFSREEGRDLTEKVNSEFSDIFSESPNWYEIDPDANTVACNL